MEEPVGILKGIVRGLGRGVVYALPLPLTPAKPMINGMHYLHIFTHVIYYPETRKEKKGESLQDFKKNRVWN